MRYRRVAIILGLVAALAQAGAASELIARCYDGDRGGVALRAHRVFRMSDGRLWVNFAEGIEGWDGRRLETIPALASAGVFVYDVVETDDGRRWTAHSDGLSVLTRQNRLLRHYSVDDGLPRNAVTAVLVHDDLVLVVTPSGGFRLDDGLFVPEQIPRPTSGSVTTALEIAAGGAAVALADGIVSRRTDDGRWVAVDPWSGGADAPAPESLAAGPDGRLSLTLADRMVLLDDMLTPVFELPLPAPAQRGAFRHGVVLDSARAAVLTDEAVWVRSDERWKKIRHPSREPFDYRNRLTIDHEGLVWAPHRRGTLKVERFDLTRWTTDDGLPTASMRAIVVRPDGGQVAVTGGGIAIRSPGGDRFQSVPPGDPAAAGDFEAASVAADGTVFAVARDRIVQISGSSSRVLPVSRGIDGRLTDIAVNSTGTTWIATRSGVHEVAGDGSRRHWSNADGLPHDACFSLAVAADDSLWIATYGGGLAHLVKGRVQTISSADGLATDRLVDVEVAPDRSVWTCGFGGVSRISPDGEVSSWMAAEGKGPDAAICVSPDSDGAWVFADGLWRVPIDGPPRLIFTTKDPAIGMTAASFHASLAVAADGSVLLASDLGGGLLEWRPDGGAGNLVRRDERCWIVAARVDATPLEQSRPNQVLPDRWSRLRLSFTAASLVREDSTRFSYRMVGYDQGWSEPTDSAQVEYTGIGFGPRRFEVRAHFHDGSISPTASLDLRVPAPWWQQPIAIAGWVVAALLAAWLLVRVRIAALLRRQHELGNLVNRRTRQLVDANTELRRLSTTDQLTGLLNRHGFSEQIEAIVGDRRRPELAMFLMLDLDYFKQINDRFGHEVGDEALREFGRLISSQMRAGDLVVRWGGDEVLVIARIEHLERAEEVARRLRQALNGGTVPVAGHGPIELVCSGGFACWPFGNNGASWRDVLRLADSALLAAKARGRNRIIGVAPGELQAGPLASEAAELEEAAANGEVVVFEVAIA